MFDETLNDEKEWEILWNEGVKSQYGGLDTGVILVYSKRSEPVWLELVSKVLWEMLRTGEQWLGPAGFKGHDLVPWDAIGGILFSLNKEVELGI